MTIRDKIGPALRVALALALSVVVSAAAASPAAAGEWTEAFCQAPNSAAATSEGWSPFSIGYPGYGSDATTNCSPGTPMLAMLGWYEPVQVGTYEGLAYTPPAGSTLAGGELDLTVSADGHGYDASGLVAVFSPKLEYNGNTIFQCADEVIPCPNGSTDWTGLVGIPANLGGNLYVGAACGGDPYQECDEGGYDFAFALADVWWADLLLDTTTAPTASAIGGPLLEANARASRELTLTASEPSGPGIYTVSVQVEGKTLYDGVPDTNNGRCTPSGEYASTLVFDFAQPCASTAPIDLPIETTALTDGKHTLKVTVTDAAGTSSVVYDGPISTLNAPESSTPPTVTSAGEVQVGGAALTATPGSWSAPTGAGTVTYQYQWQDCSGEGATGANCLSIAGAEKTSYTPAPSDVGHTLRVLVTAADNDGFEQEPSTPTATVAAATTTQEAPHGPGGTNPTETPPTTTTPTPEKTTPTTTEKTTTTTPTTTEKTTTPTTTNTTPTTTTTAPTVETTVPAAIVHENGVGASEQAIIRLGVPRDLSRSYEHRALAIKGRLLSATGEPITGAELDVLAQPLGSDQMHSVGQAESGHDGDFTARVPAGPSRIIELAYRAYSNDSDYAALAKVTEAVRADVRLHVAPTQIGPHGSIVLSGQVLGHIPRKGVVVELLVHYRGRWEPFRDPRTDSDGRFSAVYRFQGAIGTYPFKAEVLAAQSGFDYANGESETVNVKSG